MRIEFIVNVMFTFAKYALHCITYVRCFTAIEFRTEFFGSN